MSDPYDVVYTSAAARQLRKLDHVARDRVVRTIEILRTTPRPPQAKKLAGRSEQWRVRTGNYRIIYRIADQQLVIVVVAVGHRRDVYR